MRLPRKNQKATGRRMPKTMTQPRNTLGDYLTDAEPVSALWPDLVNAVYSDGPQVDVDRLSPSAQVLFYSGDFMGEMVNGGISQFFSNSSGNHAHETLAALRTIGAVLCAELLEKALTLFPGGIAPVDWQKRLDLLSEFEEHNVPFLDELNQFFDARIDALGGTPDEDVFALELAFMQAHRSDSVLA